jgi:hypothetical protein
MPDRKCGSKKRHKPDAEGQQQFFWFVDYKTARHWAAVDEYQY